MHYPKLEHFSFWQPVSFTQTPERTLSPGTSMFTDIIWRLGSLADQFTYLGTQKLNVEVLKLDAKTYSFQLKDIKEVSNWNTALKISIYALTLLILPAVALVIKYLFKTILNDLLKNHAVQNPNEVLAEKLIGKTKIVLLTGDLLSETTDAITNAASAGLWAGGGICGVIHTYAGEKPFDECKTILKRQNRTKINVGEAVLTSAGDLYPRIKAIVHIPGPDCRIKQENANKKELLTKAITSGLELVTEPSKHVDFISVNTKPLRTVSFPSISTGIFQYPLEEAAKVVLEAVKVFVEAHPDSLDEVHIVCLPHEKDPQGTALAFKEALESM